MLTRSASVARRALTLDIATIVLTSCSMCTGSRVAVGYPLRAVDTFKSGNTVADDATKRVLAAVGTTLIAVLCCVVTFIDIHFTHGSAVPRSAAAPEAFAVTVVNFHARGTVNARIRVARGYA